MHNNECCCEDDDVFGHEEFDIERYEMLLSEIPFWYAVVPPLVAILGIVWLYEHVQGMN